jgi:hypothetical protein
MARVFSRDDVLRLAPDGSSAKSGQELAQARKWVTLGGDDQAIWGQCQGSGAKPYQVQIELAEPAFKCSCPSRKFPCKHGVGLLLIYATSPASIVKAERPGWVSEWLASREARAAKAAEKKTQEPQAPDPAAQAKRREKRIERIRTGIGELSEWIRDFVRAGIEAAPRKGFEFFDGQARRMIDAQAPGMARLIRHLGSLAARGAGWQRPFMEQLGLLHLLVRATERLDDLPRPMRADIESVLGLTTSSDELDALPSTADRWQVIAQEHELEDRLRVQRTWLYGVNNKRAAMVLQFAHGTAAFDAVLSPGTQFDGQLVFFPGSGPRANVRGVLSAVVPLQSLDGCASFEDMLDRYSRAVADLPWLERLCLPLGRITPTRIESSWWAIDSDGAALPVRAHEHFGFVLLAASGGKPVDIAAEFDGQMLRPLSVIEDGRWISLASQLAEAA